jgi:hypothetical protein
MPLSGSGVRKVYEISRASVASVWGARPLKKALLKQNATSS